MCGPAVGAAVGSVRKRDGVDGSVLICRSFHDIQYLHVRWNAGPILCSNRIAQTQTDMYIHLSFIAPFWTRGSKARRVGWRQISRSMGRMEYC